ncbi:amidohydrolase family protein [Chitinasiproducens palmae]|uniref:Predicted metal-dependent hydrolase, TIM-barrel fold n=1 Tax=Chitinasiproducens palmae TaxID=1770053 RepID=A0A1H2PK64_9BURK|nr:amidohydrolase family protein [Chitinasiproducens palmae]SDV46684.1 Predicted metal-dependent hydrolase, TIM-barrel fold [Chitinasiproducens palmae]
MTTTRVATTRPAASASAAGVADPAHTTSSSGRYDGPIIDAHQHFWDLTLGKHPWLAPGVRVPHRYGDYEAVKHDYLPDDYRRDAGPHRIIASIYVDAEWDPTDGLEETRFVHALHARTGLPNAMVAQAWLDHDDAGAMLAAQAAAPLVRSVRHKPGAAATPEAALAGERSLMSAPQWRRGYAQLAAHGLHFDLQVPWWQLHEAALLARDFPATTLIVNHAGVPGSREAPTLDGWRRALDAIAPLPNVFVKVSGLCEADHPWRRDRQTAILDALFDRFGAERLMFGSNFPVDGLFVTLGTLLDDFKALLADRPEAQQRAFFHDTALRIYRPVMPNADDARTDAPQ